MLLAAPVYGPRIATLYERLGRRVRDASQEEIRSAYRGLARRLHPDRGGAGLRGRHGRGQRGLAGARRSRSPAPATTPRPGQRAVAVGDAGVTAASDSRRGRRRRRGRGPLVLGGRIALDPVLAVLGGIFLFTAYARGGGGDGPVDRARGPRWTASSSSGRASCSMVRPEPSRRRAAAPHLGVVGPIVTPALPCPPADRGLLQPGRQPPGLHHAGLTSSRTPWLASGGHLRLPSGPGRAPASSLGTRGGEGQVVKPAWPVADPVRRRTGARRRHQAHDATASARQVDPRLCRRRARLAERLPAQQVLEQPAGRRQVGHGVGDVVEPGGCDRCGAAAGRPAGPRVLPSAVGLRPAARRSRTPPWGGGTPPSTRDRRGSTLTGG